MVLRCIRLLKATRSVNLIVHNVFSTSAAFPEPEKLYKPKEFKTEGNLIYYEDPDKFGTLSPRLNTDKVILEDKGDLKEQKFLEVRPVPSQKLTIRQYADLIKQYLKHKRLKEAINILEERMLKEDRVKPENYIYNILIGACADVGYTKKAFKLFNEMKRRALKPTGDTYTCLFHACSNSPWPEDGLKLASHIRQLITEKGIEPNLTNYNAMIKAFGRCGDLSTAFKIVDEMVSKKIKIRVHTFNHLLQACISEKENGLRHALVVWRKMLQMREKPNIYTFNLMLKCVKDCNLGTKEDIEDLIGAIQEEMALGSNKHRTLQIESVKPCIVSGQEENNVEMINEVIPVNHNLDCRDCATVYTSKQCEKELSVANSSNNLSIQLVNLKSAKEVRTLPNLLSKVLQLEKVESIQEVSTLQEKFAVCGGQEDFLKEMEVYSLKPDIKTFTQMLPLLEETTEAEHKLLKTMKALKIKADIDFYNMLIKKRCLRSDYDAAFDVMHIIEKEGKKCRKRYPQRKKLHLKPNIMSYGVLAMACKTKENAEKLLTDMRDAKIKVNIEILGTMLRQGTANNNFGYVLYIMNMVKEENLQPNQTFLKHLEAFIEKCTKKIAPDQNGKIKGSDVFIKAFHIFSMGYKNWLKDININEVLKHEHPWAQFNFTCPETVQRQNITIKPPKKFYKRNRKFVKYKPQLE